MRFITTIAIGCLMMSSFSSVYAAQTVRIVVRVPAGTPADPVYVAGSLASVGGWKADGVKLARQSDKTYTGNLDLEAGQTMNFKITRGSWQTVEKNADGSEHANRTVVVEMATKQIDVTVERWASDDRRSEPVSTVVGDLKLHKIDSRVLKQSRAVRIWLPPGYEADTKVRYSVLYMHDGQNCFDRTTSAFGNEWEIDETLTKLISNKRITPMIVVGIDHGLANRINELTYNADSERGGGQGSTYAEFLLTEVKPFVDKTYRTKLGQAHTFLGGSSLGGLISLEIARRHPDKFGGVIAMSPAIVWAGQSLTQDVERDAGGLSGARIWIDMGSREGIPQSAAGTADNQSQRFVAAARRLDEALAKHRIDHRLVIDDEHAEHNELAWANRFPQAIAYINNAKN